MDYTIYNPNNSKQYSSSSTPILIPSSCSRSIITKNSKNKRNNNTRSSNNNNNNNNKKQSKDGVRLSTDPQSVAARERRHRISERLKILQSLVPGGAKLDIVSMLEQAIQYVKFLKAQIWLHEAIINNNNNIVDNTNKSYQYDHSLMRNNGNSSGISINDAYFYDQYYYALMYNCHNYNDDNVGQQGGGGGGNPQGISMASARNQAAETQESWACQEYDQQSMYYKRPLN